jgi:hypothetical protein
MTNELHRPGPWRVTPGQEYGEYWLQEEIEAKDVEHDEANARLMSYAPAMAQALLDLLEWQARMGDFESEVWSQARAAHARARGWKESEDP